MNCIVHDKTVTVTLSRANLVTLLDKLTRESSHFEIIRGCGGLRLVVRAESDEQHYAERERGRMDDRAEAAIVADRLS